MAAPTNSKHQDAPNAYASDHHDTAVSCTAPVAALGERDPNVNVAVPQQDVEKATKPSIKKPTRAQQRKSAPKPSSTQSSKDAHPTPTPTDLSTVHLPGEETESVPIFSTCDDIRRQINSHLSGTGLTKAAFIRTLTSLLPTSSVSARQLDSFLKMKGARAGGHNIVFYAAYVFFEKIRIQQGKSKGKKREKMEEIWAGEGGLPREGSHNVRMFCFQGEKPVVDQYGEFQIKGMPTGNGLSKKMLK